MTFNQWKATNRVHRGSSQMLLHLGHCTWLPLLPINKQNKSVVKELFGFKKSRRNGSLILNAVEKDSEFEIDPDKAREALKKLDEQLQSLSNKQATPPKIRAQDLYQSSSREEEEDTFGFSGSFLAYAASLLLVFTIFYNVLFLTVIKPSIDGPEPEPDPEPVQSADIIKEAQKGAPQQQLSTITEFPVGP